MLRNVLRWARVTREVAKGLQFAAQQVNYLNKTADSAMLFPFGVYANLPPDVLTLIASVQGNPDNRVALGCLLKDRPDLESGETAFYHPATGSFIIWRQGGNLEINTDADITANCANATITAETKVTIDSPTTDVTGLLNVLNSLNVTGTVTNNGKNIGDTHSHTGSPTAPNGPVSNTGTVV